MIKYKNNIFENISVDAFQQIKKDEEKRKFSKNETIRFIGDECNYIDLIVKGSVEGEHLTEDGSKLIVRVFKQNETLGLNVAFSSNPVYALNFVALEDVEIISIKTGTLLKIMGQDEQLMSNILQNLSDNSIRIGQRVKKEFKVTIKMQLLSYLKTLYIQQQRNPAIIPISKLKISEHFGVSRTSISRTFTILEQEEFIKLDNRKVFLCNKFKNNILDY